MQAIMIILFVIGILSIIISLFFFFVIYKKQQEKNSSTMMFLEYDANKNRIKETKRNEIENNKNEKIRNRNQFKKILPSDWTDANFFFNKFNKKNTDLWRNKVQTISQNKNYLFFSFEHEVAKKNMNWFVEFFYLSNDEIKIVITLTPIADYKKIKVVSPQDIISNQNSKYKLFIAFNMTDWTQENIKLFLTHVSNNVMKEEFSTIIIKSNVILILESDSFSKIQKYKCKYSTKFFDEKSKVNVLNYISSSAFVEAKDLDTIEKWSQVLIRIYFGIIKSKMIEKPFYFDIKSIFYDEFQEYKKNMSIINNIIRTNQIYVKEVSLLNSENNLPEKAVYWKPMIKMENNAWSREIIDSKNYTNTLEDKFFEVSLEKKINREETCIIDINDYLVKANIENMRNMKNTIFIINFKKINSFFMMQNLINFLVKNNIFFGIKLTTITPESISLLKNMKNSIVVIDKNALRHDKNIKEDYLKKMMNNKILQNVCRDFKITIIYEINENNKDIIINTHKIKYLYIDNQ